MREPFFDVIWTLLFAGLSVAICTAIGLLLASLVQWEPCVSVVSTVFC